MIIISKKYLCYSGKGQGSIENYVYMVGGLIIKKIEKRRASIAKGLKEWRGFSGKRGKGEGLRAKSPFFFLSPATKTEEGERVAPATWADGPGARRRPWGGEKGEEAAVGRVSHT